MSEKVLHEVRFVETDDGFRIEIRGDKEKIREMGFGPGLGMMMGFGHRMRHKHHRWHGRHRHGHHGGAWFKPTNGSDGTRAAGSDPA